MGFHGTELTCLYFFEFRMNIFFYVNSECSFTKSFESVQIFFVFSSNGHDDACRDSKDSKKKTVFKGSLDFE